MANVADALNQYLVSNGDGEPLDCLSIPEGTYRGWVPRQLYSLELRVVRLPFLRLLSFPVGGTSLGSLSRHLIVLDAVGNNLFKLSASFVECNRLTTLNLGFNHFTEIPFPVYRLSQLEVLILEHNYIETIHSSIEQLKNLRVLNLSGNLLSEVPDELKRCRRLQELHLSGNFYPRGHLKEFPECICSLTELIYLDLSWQQIKNIPETFGNLRKLQVLNLKWNQLQTVSLEMRRCTKLRRVNLSGALRLMSGIPDALFCLEDLHELYLSDNFFTDIPEKVCGMVKLKTLAVQRNSLLRISPDLFKLRYLETLELSDNYLESIPAGIKNLKKLKCLGLANNTLTELPDEIRWLEQLKFLHLGNNQITKLPETIYHLHNLIMLDVNNNQLTEIPLLLDQLEQLAEHDGLSIVNNNLRSPYKEICELGTQALFEFLKGIRLKEAHHRWKMILIGAAQAGKTSLRQALMLGRSKLTAEHERTWVMERHLWEPESRIRVQILDFGGHHIYQAAHHMFLSPDALHILVFDLTKYTSEVYEDLIGHWLEAIMDRAAGAKIVIVGTHCDLCTNEDTEDKVQDILRLMKRDEGMKRQQIDNEIRLIQEELDNPESREVSGGIPEIGVGRMQEKLNKLLKMRNSRSQIPDKIFVVSCADSLMNMELLRNFLIEKLKFEAVSALPEHWFIFLEQMQQLPEKVLTWNRTLELFLQVMAQNQQSMMGMGGSPERSLEMVLKYFHSTGEIVWYHENDQLKATVFHKPESLIDMLRVVFRHDFKQVVYYDKEVGETVSIREEQFTKMKRDFLNKGLMTKEMLRYLLIHFKLSEEAPETFLSLILSLMIKFNLCFELTDSTANALLGSSQIVQFPWFFPGEPPPELESKWPSSRPANNFELCMEILFPGRAPPNFFEKLSVKLHHFLSDANRVNWKNGVLAERNYSKLLVVREKRNGSTVVVVSARGASDLKELWWLIINVRKAAMSLFKDWPLLKCEISLVCGHCILKDTDEPYRYPGHVLEHVIPKGLYVIRCCEKFPDDEVPTCFVFPLDDLDEESHQDHMRVATNFLFAAEDVVDGPQSGIQFVLSDTGLSFIASNLGANWILIALSLGVQQIRIEQLQMDHKSV
ncbi:unnamed protein product, partial [Lymnaea stagnalis]